MSQASDVLLPPAPNWFNHHTFHCRQEDSLVAAASFRTIVIYQISLEASLPKVFKKISYKDGKVTGVRLFHDCQNPIYSHCLAATSDHMKVTLIDFHTGDILKSHQEHKATVTGISWAELGGESVIVSVGGNGQMAVWDPNELAPQVHILSYHTNLHFVETLPHQRDQVIVGADKLLVHVSLADGGVLHQFKGHDHEIYTLAWYQGSGCPIEVDHSSVEPDIASEPKNTDENIDKGSDSSNWRESKSFSGDPGPFFATSDMARNIFIWSFTAKRYIFKISVPSSSFKKNQKGGKQQIALAWHNNMLLSSTSQGELISWKLEPNGAGLETLHHLHSRVIFNLVVVKNIAITSGQDRLVVGYRLDNKTQLFQVPALGSSCNTMQICPQDANRLAIGFQENCVKVLTFGTEVPLNCKSYFLNIKGKVYSISWHPQQEGLLLFGTSDGQVGFIDVNSGKVNQFSYFHQRPSYKVEWAPPLCNPISEDITDYYAYSFGDKEIVMRSLSDLNADPVFVKNLLPENMKSKFLKDITEFSFSFDYKYLAMGAQDGQIQVYNTETMALLVTYTVLRKPIQHILWKPPVTAESGYTFVVGSNETRICIFYLEDAINAEKEELMINQANLELHGHSGRVLWLSWSPHNDGMLASASYDNTIKLWDTLAGRKIGTYAGHTSRVMRVEFSLSDPDSLFSFSDDNSLHSWNLSKLEEKSPVKMKRANNDGPRKTKRTNIEDQKSTEQHTDNHLPTQVRNKTVRHEKSGGSLFPEYHKAASKKKQFHHLAILSMAHWQHCNNKAEDNSEEQLEEELDNLEEETQVPVTRDIPMTKIVEDCLEKYNFLQSEELNSSEHDDLLHMLDFHGRPEKINNVLTKEIAHFEAKENTHQATILNLWNSSLESQIRTAAQKKTLTPFLVSLAPQISYQLWESTCDAYAQQLVDEGEIPAAASYYVSINKVPEAVSLLIKHKYHKEAVVVAKSRGTYDRELLKKAITSWASFSILEGNFETTSFLHTTNGNIEEAARILSRRTDPGSIITAAELYKLQGNDDLAYCHTLSGLKEASIKNDFEKIMPCIALNPQLEWYKAIHICHTVVLETIEKTKTNLDWRQRYILSSKCHSCLKNYLSTKKGSSIEDNNASDECTCLLTEEGKQCVLQHIKDIWQSNGIEETHYKNFYSEIMNKFSTQQLPNSTKHFWFLVSLSFCKLLLTDNEEDQEEFLQELLNYVLNWGKPDLMYHLTHILFAFGLEDNTTLMVKDENKYCDKVKEKIKQLYCLSELSVYMHMMNGQSVQCPWNQKLNNSSSTETTQVNGKNDDAVNGEESENSNSINEIAPVVSNGLQNDCSSTQSSESHEQNKDESNLSTEEKQSLMVVEKEANHSNDENNICSSNMFFSWDSEQSLVKDIGNYRIILSSMDEAMLSLIKTSSLDLSSPMTYLSEFLDKLRNYGALTKPLEV